MRILHFRGAQNALGRLWRENVITPKDSKLKVQPSQAEGFLFQAANLVEIIKY